MKKYIGTVLVHNASTKVYVTDNSNASYEIPNTAHPIGSMKIGLSVKPSWVATASLLHELMEMTLHMKQRLFVKIGMWEDPPPEYRTFIFTHEDFFDAIEAVAYALDQLIPKIRKEHKAFHKRKKK